MSNGIDLIPTRAEEQPVVLHDPGMLGLLLIIAGRIQVNIIDPLALLGGRQHLVAEDIPVDVSAQVTLQVLANILGNGGVGDYPVVLPDDEHVPFTVNAFFILEDNLRVPPGIAYQAKATEIGLRVMPELAQGYDIIPYDIKSTYQEMFLSLCDTSRPPVCS